MVYMFVKVHDTMTDEEMKTLEEAVRFHINVDKVWWGASPTSGFTKKG